MQAQCKSGIVHVPCTYIVPMYLPYPVPLASVYATLTAEEVCQIGWELFSSRLEDYIAEGEPPWLLMKG